MTTQTFPRGAALPPWPLNQAGQPSFNSSTVDGANEIFAVVIRAPKAGNIRGAWWRMGSVTTGGDITVGVYQVDTTTGNPADTPVLHAANTSVTKTIATTDANDFIYSGNFTADATVTKGQLIAICFINPGASFGNMVFQNLAEGDPKFPYGTHFTTSWTKVSGHPNILLEYSDGTVAIPMGCVAIGDAAATSIPITATLSTSTTPDVWGAEITLPFPIRLSAVWFWGDDDGDYDVRVVTSAWDGASSGLLASGSGDSNVRVSAAANITLVELDATVEIAAGTRFRILVIPNTTTSMTCYSYPCVDSDHFGAQPLAGANFHLTTAKDPTGDGSFTDYDNGTDGYRIPLMGMILDGFSDGVGGGSANLLHGKLQ